MLSQREQDTWDFIRGYIVEHGRGPLLAEIAEGLGIRSRGVVHRYVQAVAEAGLITLEPGRHRGIRLADGGSGSAQEGGQAMILPLLGRIAAGLPIEAIPDQQQVDLADFFMGPNRFVLRVQGESMIEAGILPDDMVIVESRSQARNGDIVVALIDQQEATLKRLQHNPDGSVTLFPANCHMAPMIYPAERVQIQGVVVGQMRSYQ
jgi:repressor LexA